MLQAFISSAILTIMKRMYEHSEMARIASPDCKGCGRCCIDMGESVRLDPFDLHMLSVKTGKSFSGLLSADMIGLHAEDGIVLPHLSMGGTDSRCRFLSESMECSIHDCRPGLCRLFPLGREYTDGSFRYFIVEDACPRKTLSKVRISDWLGISDISRYTSFITSWHSFILRAKESAVKNRDGSYASALSSFIIKVFYETPYLTSEGIPAGLHDLTDFTRLFEMRLSAAKEAL